MSGDADYVRGYSVSGDTVCQVIHYVRGYSVRGCRLSQGTQCVR